MNKGGVLRVAAQGNMPIAVGAENFAKRKKELGPSGPAQSLRASDYAAFNLALLRAASRHGVEVLLSDTTEAALVGYAKYSQVNGLSIGCSAAMLIARRAVLAAPDAAARPSGNASNGGKTALKKSRRSAGQRRHQERVAFPRSMPAIERCIERRPRGSD